LSGLEITCVVAFALAAWHFAGYPVVLFVLAALRRGKAPAAAEPRERVAMIVAAFNEERVIAAKLENALSLDYPPGLFTVVVAADGSSDRTPDIVRAFGDPRVVCMHEAARRGKGHALNRAVAATDCDVLVLSDANNAYSKDAILRLVARLREPGVGGATGAKKIVASRERAASGGDGLYWRYESKIKTAESALGGTVTADGEIFALRKASYREIPANVINDDMYLTFRLVDEKLRVVYEPDAVAVEEASITIREDFNTKVRMIAGGMQSMRLELRTIFSSAGFAAKFLSHKLLRWIMPLVLLTLFVTSALLVGRQPFGALFAAQIAFYLLAALGWLLNGRNSRPTFAYVPFYFVVMNCAAAGGLWRYLRGRHSVLWTKAAR
jgi:cellulose synthase/poly-beta-1,6-N-acetylglucosamine synthase-like glycosyltransferase